MCYIDNISGRISAATRWALMGAAAMLACIAAVGGSAARAETLTFASSSATAEAAWTNCPVPAAFDGQPCNYTAVYAAVGDQFQPVLIIQMANLRVYLNGTTQVQAAAAGYVQPASNIAIDAATLASAFAAGDVYLYGNCGDPANLATCSYYGVGSVSASWGAAGNLLSWDDNKNIAEAENTLSYSIVGDSVPAGVTATAGFQGAPWDLGRPLSARITAFNINQTLTCPEACAGVQVPNASALMSGFDAREDQPGPDPDARRNVPPKGLRNAINRSPKAARTSAAESGFDPFDFSPLGQVRSIFYSTGFYGSTALQGLNQFVDNLESSYLSSGRRLGFFPQAFNSDAYFNASSFNTSGVFFRFNDPFGG
jgi:hypothetical protein